MADGENQFIYATAGQADWDTTLNANLSIIEKGYRTLGQAGMVINTGHVLWMNSGGFFFHFDPNSTAITPTHFAHIGAASGDSMTPIAWGSVYSLGICSPAVPGKPLFTSLSTPGVVVGSFAGADRQIGWGIPNYGVLFKPNLPAASGGETTIVTTFVAGAAVNTGHVLYQVPADRSVIHFDPNSQSIYPLGVALNGGTGVGSVITTILMGPMRGYGITSAAPLALPCFTSALTPGVLVGSYNGAWRPIGYNIGSWGIMVNPRAFNALPETLNSSVAIAAVTGSLHLFTIGVGRLGINRETVMIGASADLVELKFYQDSAKTKLLYSTKSGGVSVVGSFQDRALWPWENGETPNSASIYGTLMILSPAAVGSDTISIQGAWDRTR